MRLEMEEFDAEEKPKTYVCKERRFNKKDIGCVTGYEFNECMLLENNPSEVCKIILAQQEEELKNIEEKLVREKEKVEVLRNYIKEEVFRD